jgi:transposase
MSSHARVFHTKPATDSTEKLPPPRLSAQIRGLPEWSEINREFKREGVTLFLIWQEYRERHSQGYQYSHFFQQCRQWQGKQVPNGNRSGLISTIMSNSMSTTTRYPISSPSSNSMPTSRLTPWSVSRITSHARSPIRGRHTTVQEHMSQAHRQYGDWSPQRLINWS